MTFSTIIWDWNGTLLNDVAVCISSMNRMLSLRGLKPINEKRYRDIFTFPVKDYYDQLGFDPAADPFEKIGLEFIRYFREELPSVGLQNGAATILSEIRKSGRRQVIVSAMEHHSLVKSIQNLGIEQYFDHIFGIDNDYGGGKTALAKRVAGHLGTSGNCLMIGDTLHDAEVAGETGWQCVLTASGHQSYQRLQTAGVPVFQNLGEIMNWLNSPAYRQN